MSLKFMLVTFMYFLVALIHLVSCSVLVQLILIIACYEIYPFPLNFIFSDHILLY